MKQTIITVILSVTMFSAGLFTMEVYHDYQKAEKRAERIISEACGALYDQDGTPWDECMKQAGYVIKF